MTEGETSREAFAGTVVEIDGGGDYSINTSEAVGGDVVLNLSDGRAFKIVIGGAPVLEVTANGSSVRIDIGGGAQERLVLGDALKELLNQFFLTKFDVHMHPTAMGPSGPPLPAFTGVQITDDVLSDVARTKKS